jgi:hypothetical protein
MSRVECTTTVKVLHQRRVVSSVVQLQTSQSTPASAPRIHVDASPALRRLDTFHPGALYIALVARSNGVLYRFPTENNRIAVIVQDTPKQCPHRPTALAALELLVSIAIYRPLPIRSYFNLGSALSLPLCESAAQVSGHDQSTTT